MHIIDEYSTHYFVFEKRDDIHQNRQSGKGKLLFLLMSLGGNLFSRRLCLFCLFFSCSALNTHFSSPIRYSYADKDRLYSFL